MLFHWTQVDPLSKIITRDFKYAIRSLFRIEAYFTNKLDYTSYYTEGTNLDKIILLSNCGKDLRGKKIWWT